MTIIRDWTPDKSHAFGKEVLTFNHDLHTRPMFDDDGLADLLDRYPRDKLGVFTMGEDPREWRTTACTSRMAPNRRGEPEVTHRAGLGGR